MADAPLTVQTLVQSFSKVVIEPSAFFFASFSRSSHPVKTFLKILASPPTHMMVCTVEKTVTIAVGSLFLEPHPEYDVFAGLDDAGGEFFHADFPSRMPSFFCCDVWHYHPQKMLSSTSPCRNRHRQNRCCCYLINTAIHPPTPPESSTPHYYHAALYVACT